MHDEVEVDGAGGRIGAADRVAAVDGAVVERDGEHQVLTGHELEPQQVVAVEGEAGDQRRHDDPVTQGELERTGVGQLGNGGHEVLCSEQRGAAEPTLQMVLRL